MPLPRLLIMEGNTAEGRALLTAAGGDPPSVGYASLLTELVPEAVIDICYPADAGATLPDGAALEEYDGVAITGSGLHVYEAGPAVDRQIAFVRALLAARVPILGSCWGLQVLTVAAGGVIRRNPRGREIGFGRRIALTEAGRSHAMYDGKPQVFEAITVHLDEVATLAPGTRVLATNAVSDVQAAEIHVDGAIAWGVQYHPEYSLHDIASTMRRHGKRLVDEGFFAGESDLLGHTKELELLHADPRNKALSWRHGIDDLVLDRGVRSKEIANWISALVLPNRSRRGRA
jgi:GMP synthase (glutamine-hydrolysing)